MHCEMGLSINDVEIEPLPRFQRGSVDLRWRLGSTANQSERVGGRRSRIRRPTQITLIMPLFFFWVLARRGGGDGNLITAVCSFPNDLTPDLHSNHLNHWKPPSRTYEQPLRWRWS